MTDRQTDRQTDRIAYSRKLDCKHTINVLYTCRICEQKDQQESVNKYVAHLEKMRSYFGLKILLLLILDEDMEWKTLHALNLRAAGLVKEKWRSSLVSRETEELFWLYTSLPSPNKLSAKERGERM